MKTNAKRKHKVHLIVFFIFLVANIGGSLTPLGDPPLFLGFLHGVSFFWTLNLFPAMLLVSIILLIILYIWDTILYNRENHDTMPVEAEEPFRVEGAFNLIFLLGVVAGVLFSGTVQLGSVDLFGLHLQVQNISRDIWIILMGFLSLKVTAKSIREQNEFSWFPIKEVAYLFAGIFMTIVPALMILKAGERGALAPLIAIVNTPEQFFWITGALSSFLDNAPTYLTFFNTALGKLGITEAMERAAFSAGTISKQYPEFLKLLKGISLGAVFMGANTYIGNAPNFMVKSIAEEGGIRMPSFFGYMLKYSIPVLIPVFFIVGILFL